MNDQINSALWVAPATRLSYLVDKTQYGLCGRFNGQSKMIDHLKKLEMGLR